MGQKIAVGMYTIHKEAEKDIVQAFKKVSEIGYTGIEFYGDHSNFEMETVKKALGEAGLELTSWHVEWRDLQPETIEKTMDYLIEVGCPVAVVPCLGGKWNVNHTPDQECLEIWLEYIEQMNMINEKLKKRGLRMGYHNHEHEFMLKYDGKTVFDIVFSGLSEDIIMEFDTGNCIEGGYDPAEIIARYNKRDILLHLKPFSRRKGFDVALGDNDDENDWESILKAKSKGFMQLIVESECSVYPEYENAQKCYDGLQRFIKG